jgi:hypothetical protein
MAASSKLLYYQCGLYTQLMELPKGAQHRGWNTYYLDEVCHLCKVQGHHDYVEGRQEGALS